MSVMGKLAIVVARQLVDNARRAGTSEILNSILTPKASAPAKPPAPAALPPARRKGAGAAARVLHIGFLVCIGLTLISLVGFLAVTSKSNELAWARLAMGLILLTEGGFLLGNWHGARTVLVAHFRARYSAGSGLWASLFWRTASFIFAVIAFVWVAIGMLAVALGLRELLT